MASEAIGPTVTVHLKLEKFDGEYAPGKEPVEVIETEETMPLAQFLTQMQGVDHG
jgi:hypothetical protein